MDPNQTTQITELLIRRRRSAILAADVAGYSRLMGADEERTLKRLDAARAIMDSRIAQQGGRIANTAGDSVIAEFPTAVAAVRCAVEVQTALRRRNESVPTAERLQFRIGINYGDVMANRADLLGDNVNIAARIENLAEPGGILISSSTHEQVYGRLEVGFRALGEQALKNIDRKVEVFEVLLDGAKEAAPTPARAAASTPSAAKPSVIGARSAPSARTTRVKPAARPKASGGAWPLVALLILIVLIAVGVIGYLIVTQLLPQKAKTAAEPAAASSATAPADAAATPAPAVVAQPAATASVTPAADLSRLGADANAALTGFTCAQLRATLSPDAVATITGFVGAATDSQLAVSRVRAVPAVTGVDDRIQVLPPPLCQVLGAVPKSILFNAAAAPPRIAVGGKAGIYQAGDHLRFRITAPPVDSYITVDYVDGPSGYVVHLLPNDLRPDGIVAANQQFVIGDLAREIERYGITEPFGLNLVIVLSAPRPLLGEQKAMIDTIGAYLPKLSAALAAQPDATVTFATVNTAP